MKREFSPTIIILIFLTMPIHFLIGFAMVLRGKLPWSLIDKKETKLKTYKKQKPRYKRSLRSNPESSYI